MAKQLSRMEITPAENGGHTIRHSFKSKPTLRKGGMNSGMGMEYQEPEEHVFGKDEGAKVMSHIGKHLGLGKTAKPTQDGDD